MTVPARERIPTPPIGLPNPATSTPRLGAAVVVDQVFLDEIRSTCPTDESLPTLAEHGRDWWPLAMHWALSNQVPQLPAVVCRPRDTSEVADVLRICNRHRVPVTAMGGRSSVTGAAVPARGGVALDMTALQGIVSVDRTSGVVEVLAGTFGPDLETSLTRDHRLTVGHFPQSFDLSTVGGWIASRGAGQFSTRYGKIEDMVIALEVVTADGSVVRTGGAPAAAAGPDLSQVFIGCEGTLGVITRAWLRAHPVAEHRICAAHSFDSFTAGIEACRRIIRAGATPAVLRLYDETESQRSHGADGTRAVLLVLDKGDPAVLRATESIVADVMVTLGARPESETLVEHWLEHRNDTGALQALISRGYVVDTMEVAAPWSVLAEVHRSVTGALRAVEHVRAASCHLSHSYPDGACLYFTFAAQPPTEEHEHTYRALWDAGQRAALAAGANLSHHHGIGLNRAPYVVEALGSAIDIVRLIKNALDPHGILNPGKWGLES